MRILAAILVLALLAPVAHAKKKDRLAGDWHGQLNGETLALQLGSDGRGQLQGEAITWQLLLGQLLVERQGQVTAYSVAIDGDTLTIGGGDLATLLVLQRGAAPAVSRAVTRAPQGADEPGAAASGLDPRLAGHWCYLGSFTNLNNGGGSQSSRCFQLSADGRYRYHYEGSVSAYGGGLYGGSASQSSDSGQWQVSAGTLIARSDSGQVSRYRLEKRNHPKNRDPMLCLDGDCYVTQTQKPAW